MSLIGVIKPDRVKVLAAFLVPVAFVAFLFGLNPAYQALFLRNGPGAQALGILLSVLIGMLIYYPMACGIVFLYRRFTGTGTKGRKKGRKAASQKEGSRQGRLHARREIIFAIMLIAIFNPFAYSTAFSATNYYNYNVLNKPCGLQISAFRDLSPARDAGIALGEIITSVDGQPVTNFASFFSVINAKNPGDDVLIGTNVQEYPVHMVWQNGTTPYIGVEVREMYCPSEWRQNSSFIIPISLDNSSIIAFAACKQACISTFESGDNMSVGPCLLDPIPVEPDWVCDIAHSPRLPEDNLPDNQCNFYRSGAVAHFIELSPECRLLRTG